MLDPIVRMLGEVSLIRSSGAAVALGGKARRLLLLLSLRVGEPVPKDVLSDALWGGASTGDPGVRLRMAVSRLRKQLVTAGLPEDAIQFGRESYTLAVPPEVVDAEVFTTQVDEARRVASTQPDRAASLLGEALALWSAPAPAFGALSAEPWAWAAAARLDELRAGAEEDWAAIELGRGRHTAVIDRLHEAAHRAPLRELRWIQLATALYRSGRQSEALRSLQEAREVLREEVGVEPGPDLRRLERAILEHHSSLDDEPPQLPAHAVAPAPIGRDEDLDAVAELLERNRVVSVVGLGGVGKSMLARALAMSARGRGESTLVVPLDGLSRRSDILLAIAAKVGLGGGEDDTTLASAVAGHLQRTRLLVLDGAEADPAAVATIVEELGVASPATRILVTARVPLGAAGEVRYPLAPLPVGTAEQPGSAVTLFLARSGMSAAGLDGPALASVLRICERAAGLPLAIELVASSLDRYGLRELDAAGDGAGLPVRRALEGSLAVLPAASRQLLLDVALLPDGASLELAADLAAVPAAEIRSVIGPLAQLRLLEVRNDLSTIRYRPLEPVREAALDLGGPDPDAATRIREVLLARAEAVGDLHEIPRLDALQGVEAELGNLRHWLDLTVGTVEGLELAIALTPALVELGADGESATWLRRHRAAVGERDALLDLRSVVALANSGGFGAGPAFEIAELEQAMATAEALAAWPLWFLVRSYLVLAQAWAGDIPAALELLDGELAQARMAEHGTPWFETQRQRLLALGMSSIGLFDEALAELAGMPERFEALGDASNALVTRYLIATTARAAGDLDSARQALEAARDRAPSGVRRTIVALVDAELALLARADGDLTACAQLAEAIAALERSGNLRMAAVHRRDLGRWHLQDGDPVQALHDLRASLPLLITIDRRGAASGLSAIADLLAPDQPDVASRLARTAQRWASDEPGPQPAVDDLVAIEDAATRLGRAELEGSELLSDAEVLRLVLLDGQA